MVEATLKPYIHTLLGTGTSNGQSGIRQLANGCQRRYFLSKKFPDGVGKSGPLRVGSIFHAFMEMYHKGQDRFMPPSRVKFANIPIDEEDKDRLEAQRLFVAYQAKYKPTDLGRVESVEHLIDDNVIGGAAGEAVGFPGYTARLDLVTEVDDEDIEHIRNKCALNLRGPGYYAWDWKTVSWLNNIAIERYEHDLQPKYYMMAWNAAYPDKPLKGMVIVVITKTKVPKIEHVLLDLPRIGDTEMVKATSAKALRVLKGHKPPFEANPDRCFSFNKTCEFLKSGLCTRY
jgi:hypothetical protein